MENQLIDIEELTVEILLLKRQTAENIIQIGKRLLQAKEVLDHGEWGDWLREKVAFKERTAQRFMQVAKEMPNPSALTHLSQSKIFALLDLPEEQRQEFIEQQHAVNGKEKVIYEMTTRELQQVIKAKKKLEQQLKEVELSNESLKQENSELKLLVPPDPVIVEKEVIREIEKPIIPEDYHHIKSHKQQLEEKVKELSSINVKLQDQLTEAADVKLEAVHRVKFRKTLLDMTTMIAKALKEAELSKEYVSREEVVSQGKRTIVELEKGIKVIQTWLEAGEEDYIDAEYTII